MRLPVTSFGAGELSPALWDRSDFSKTQIGARLLRNCVVRTEGGFTNRPGTLMLAEVPADSVFIPFRYSATQEYVLVFSDSAMRVIKDDGLVLRSLRTTAYSWTLSSAGSGRYYLRTSAGANPALVQPAAGEVLINSAVATSGSPATLAAGTWGWGDVDSLGYSTLYVRLADDADPDGKAVDYVQAVAVTAHVYPFAVLNDLSVTQSFDTMFISHKSYPTYKLTRTDHFAWTFSLMTFAPSLSAPATVTVDPAALVDITYEYAILAGVGNKYNPALKKGTGGYVGYEAVDDTNLAALKVSVSVPNPWDGTVSIAADEVSGATRYTLVRKKSTDSAWRVMRQGKTPVFTDTNSVKGGSWKAGRAALSLITGTAAEFHPDTTTAKQFAYTVSAEADNESYPATAVESSKKVPWKAGTSVVVTWAAVANARLYNVYKNSRGTWGWIGSVDPAVDDRAFIDDNIDPDVGYGPRKAPVYDLGTNYPACCAMFQQRLVFAGPTADPARLITSAIGNLTDFSLSEPLRADDPVDARPASGKGDPVVHMVPFDSLVVFTEEAVWTLNGSQGALRADDISFKAQSFYGAAKHPAPILTGTTVLFVQRGGNVIRDLAYEFSSDKYQGNDLTVFARHLFDGGEIRRWAFEAEPASRIWTAMEDGSFRAMTYLKEHDIRAWTRHDTDGLVRSVASLNAGTYFLMKRTIATVDRYFVERLATDTEAVFTDSSLTYSGVATTTLSGLSHLEGKTVQFRGVGPAFNGYGLAVVSGGAITVPSVTSAAVGLPVVADFQSLDLNLRGEDAKRRLAPAVTLRLRNTRGVQVGVDASHGLYDAPLADVGDPGYDATTLLYNGDVRVPVDATWTTNPTIFLRQSQPYPMHVVAIVPEVVAGE